MYFTRRQYSGSQRAQRSRTGVPVAVSGHAHSLTSNEVTRRPFSHALEDCPTFSVKKTNYFRGMVYRYQAIW